jgi:hypothetical protein
MNLVASNSFAEKKQRHATVIGPSSMTLLDVKSSIASVVWLDPGVDCDVMNSSCAGSWCVRHGDGPTRCPCPYQGYSPTCRPKACSVCALPKTMLFQLNGLYIDQRVRRAIMNGKEIRIWDKVTVVHMKVTYQHFCAAGERWPRSASRCQDLNRAA